MLDNLLRILADAEFQMVTKNAADSVPKTIVAEYLKSIRAAIPQMEQDHTAAAEYEAARDAFFSLGGDTPENKASFEAAYEALVALNKIYGFPYSEYNFDL